MSAILQRIPANLAVRATVWLVLLLGAFGARAGETEASFDQANKLYEQGKFKEAIQAYDQIVTKGGANSAVYFNLGNAFFKNGQTGRAVYYYRMAQRLKPRDPDIRANLQFAQNGEASGISSTGGAASRLTQSVSLNELAVAFTVVFWIWMGILAAEQVKPGLRPALKTPKLLSALASVGAGLWLGLASYDRLTARTGVIVAREAVVRYGPLEESQSAFTAREGAELRVLDRKDDWVQVTDGGNRTGWVQTKQLIILPKG